MLTSTGFSFSFYTIHHKFFHKSVNYEFYLWNSYLMMNNWNKLEQQLKRRKRLTSNGCMFPKMIIEYFWQNSNAKANIISKSGIKKLTRSHNKIGWIMIQTRLTKNKWRKKTIIISTHLTPVTVLNILNGDECRWNCRNHDNWMSLLHEPL